MALDFNEISEDHVIKGSYDFINDTPHGKSKSSQVWLQKYNSFCLRIISQDHVTGW